MLMRKAIRRSPLLFAIENIAYCYGNCQERKTPDRIPIRKRRKGGDYLPPGSVPKTLAKSCAPCTLALPNVSKLFHLNSPVSQRCELGIVGDHNKRLVACAL